MAYTGIYRARRDYNCSRCGTRIPAGTLYYREEPHPAARIYRGVRVGYLCSSCAPEMAYFPHLGPIRHGQTKFTFTDDKGEEQLIVPSEVLVRDITPDILKMLAKEPPLLATLGSDQFEDVIRNRLEAMGLCCEKVGGSTFHKDGGIDILAVRPSAPFPFLIAVQIKHHRRPSDKTGPEPVRELLGTVELSRFNAGMLVTNTYFTPDAKWVAEQRPLILKLRDLEDLKRWLRDEFVGDSLWREIPPSIEVCPGVVVDLTQLLKRRGTNETNGNKW